MQAASTVGWSLHIHAGRGALLSLSLGFSPLAEPAGGLRGAQRLEGFLRQESEVVAAQIPRLPSRHPGPGSAKAVAVSIATRRPSGGRDALGGGGDAAGGGATDFGNPGAPPPYLAAVGKGGNLPVSPFFSRPGALASPPQPAVLETRGRGRRKIASTYLLK